MVTAGRGAGGSPRLEVIRVEDAHAPEVAQFIRAVWTPSATAESVLAGRAEAAARNVAEPGVPPPTWIALQAGKVLGYVTTIPIRLWDRHQDWPAYWIKGLMVLPEFRNGPIGYSILKAAVNQLPCTGALAVAAPARRLFVALGYTDLGAVPNWIRPVAPHNILRRLDLETLGLQRLPRWVQQALGLAQATGLATVAGWSGGLALRAIAGALRLPATGLKAHCLDPRNAADELDALWGAVREGFPTGVVRDASYLRHRYGPGADSPYEWLAVRDQGALAGIAIIRRPRPEGDPRLQGIRVATLADLLFSPGRPIAGVALLGAAEHFARQAGADAILATCSAPSLRRVLRRQLYLPIGGNVHFLFRDSGGQSGRFGSTLEDWWLTRGDGGADEVF